MTIVTRGGRDRLPLVVLSRATITGLAPITQVDAAILAVALLLPALYEGSPVVVAAGSATGVAFLLLSRRAFRNRDVHVGELSGAGVQRSALVFSVLLVHSLPEGFAIGTAFALVGAGLMALLATTLGV